MSIASAIATKQQQVADSYTSVSNKGGTLPTTQNLTNLATAISSIPSGGGGGKYQLLQRISDDNGNEIGTVSGFFTDANDVEYAVVCLDAQYRLASGAYCSDNSIAVTDLPLYNTWAIWEAKETATFNTQKILDFCTANNYTSQACSHCRTLSFTIDGVTYYGQLPNMIELNDIVRNHTALNTADTTASSYSSVNFSNARNRWSSSQSSRSVAWYTSLVGNMTNVANKTSTYGVVPVLEIPNI